MPRLPEAGSIDLDGAAVATAAGALHVAVVARRGGRRDSRVLVFRWAGGRWAAVGARTPLRSERGGRVDLLGGRRPCVAAGRGGHVRLWCLRGDRWISGGPAAFPVGDGASFGGAFLAGGRTLLLRTRRVATALAPGSRLQATAFGRIGGRWIADSPGELDPTAPGGTQRPFGLAIVGAPCAAYDALPADRRTSPVPRLSCLRGRRWRAVGPPLDPTGGAPVPGVAFGVDGAVGVGGTAYVGVDRFVGRAVDWRVHALIGGRWRATALGGDDPEWNEQGTLFAVRGEPWAIRFDQRTTERSLATRVVVLRLDRHSGRAVQVGSPLRDAERFTVPLSYGLATVGRRVYAMATVPNARTGRDEARAFVLR